MGMINQSQTNFEEKVNSRKCVNLLTLPILQVKRKKSSKTTKSKLYKKKASKKCVTTFFNVPRLWSLNAFCLHNDCNVKLQIIILKTK